MGYFLNKEIKGIYSILILQKNVMVLNPYLKQKTFFFFKNFSSKKFDY